MDGKLGDPSPASDWTDLFRPWTKIGVGFMGRLSTLSCRLGPAMRSSVKFSAKVTLEDLEADRER